jgi:hypothetical protein
VATAADTESARFRHTPRDALVSPYVRSLVLTVTGTRSAPVTANRQTKATRDALAVADRVAESTPALVRMTVSRATIRLATKTCLEPTNSESPC